VLQGTQEIEQEVVKKTQKLLVLIKKNAAATSVWLLFAASSALSGQ